MSSEKLGAGSPWEAQTPEAAPPHAQWAWAAGVAVVALVLAARIFLHAEGANGPWYWRWRWNVTEPLRAYPAMALGLLPFLGAQWLFARRTLRSAALSLLTLSTLLFAVANTAMREPDWSLTRPVSAVVENRIVSGYLTDARRFDQPSLSRAVGDWLREFDRRSPSLSLHGRNKPPGAVLFFTLALHLLGDEPAFAAGLLVGLLATLAIPACYLLLRTLGLDSDDAFHGTSFLALCPCLIVFFPLFDPLYALFSAVLLALWVAALERGRAPLAIAFGLALSLACFFSYNLLVLGAFLTAYGLGRAATRELPWARALSRAGMALATAIVVYLLLWASTHYDPLRAFRVAVENQRGLQQVLQRPYPATILYDLLDFGLGSAYVACLLTACVLFFPRHFSLRARRDRFLIALAAGQILLVAVLGLLPTETARVWGFLLPLLMVPTGIALDRFDGRGRLLLYLSAWLVLAVACQNMDFAAYKKRKHPPASDARVSALRAPIALAVGGHPRF